MSPNRHQARLLVPFKINRPVGNGARMEMNVNEMADGVTHVALDGRFDIAGAQEVDAALSGAGANRQDPRRRPLQSVVPRLARRAHPDGQRQDDDPSRRVHRRRGRQRKRIEGAALTGFNEIVGLYPDFASAAAVLKERRAEFENRKA